MNIETVGHAGLLVRDDQGTPVLFTDPWISGSCYWRSWWLQNYPAPELMAELQRGALLLDHARAPRSLSHRQHPRARVRACTTSAPTCRTVASCRTCPRRGYRASTLPAFEWRAIHDDIQILSIPLFNDDSVLLVNTPTAVIVNLNDAKPRRASCSSWPPGSTRWLQARRASC